MRAGEALDDVMRDMSRLVAAAPCRLLRSLCWPRVLTSSQITRGRSKVLSRNSLLYAFCCTFADDGL